MLKQLISNHPIIQTVNRTVNVLEVSFDEVSKKIEMEIKVIHTFNEVPITDLDKKIKLVANNTVQIEGIGDYDYLIEEIEANVGIEDLITSIIQARDLDGTINTKCGYAITVEETI